MDPICRSSPRKRSHSSESSSSSSTNCEEPPYKAPRHEGSGFLAAAAAAPRNRRATNPSAWLQNSNARPDMTLVSETVAHIATFAGNDTTCLPLVRVSAKAWQVAWPNELPACRWICAFVPQRASGVVVLFDVRDERLIVWLVCVPEREHISSLKVIDDVLKESKFPQNEIVVQTVRVESKNDIEVVACQILLTVARDDAASVMVQGIRSLVDRRQQLWSELNRLTIIDVDETETDAEYPVLTDSRGSETPIVKQGSGVGSASMMPESVFACRDRIVRHIADARIATDDVEASAASVTKCCVFSVPQIRQQDNDDAGSFARRLAAIGEHYKEFAGRARNPSLLQQDLQQVWDDLQRRETTFQQYLEEYQNLISQDVNGLLRDANSAISALCTLVIDAQDALKRSTMPGGTPQDVLREEERSGAERLNRFRVKRDTMATTKRVLEGTLTQFAPGSASYISVQGSIEAVNNDFKKLESDIKAVEEALAELGKLCDSPPTTAEEIVQVTAATNVTREVSVTSNVSGTACDDVIESKSDDGDDDVEADDFLGGVQRLFSSLMSDEAEQG